MKSKLLIFVLLAAVLHSCYDDYLTDTVGFSDVYFAQNEIKRSIMSGEGMEIKIGVNLGGLKYNEEDHSVGFVIDESLLDASVYTLMPEDYYTLSNSSEITIPSGSFLGFVNVSFDSLKLAQDMLMKDSYYALPIRIVSTSADSILAGKDYVIIPLEIMNTYEGTYSCYGTTLNSAGDTIESYGDPMGHVSPIIVDLASIMMDSVDVSQIANRGGEDYGMMLRVNASDNSVEVLSKEGSLFQVTSSKTSTWDPVKRTFNLSYGFQDEAGDDFTVEETFVFRNRTRDGIDEWRWEGFPGNL